MREVDLFYAKTKSAHSLFEELISSKISAFTRSPVKGKAPGIYVFYENGEPVYVGRTRDLSQRFRAHTTRSPNSASCALKRTRKKHCLEATYQRKGSRAEIAAHPVYGVTFLDEIEAIKRMQYRFLQVDDSIDQYLLELYATLAFNLGLDGFETS